MPNTLDRRLSRRALLALGASSAVAAACGGSDGDSATPVATSAPVATEAPPTATRVPPSPTPVPEPTTLRGWAERSGFSIGVQTGGYGYPAAYRQLTTIQQREFNLGFANVGWSLVEPRQGEFNWMPADGDINVAVTGRMNVMAGELLWARRSGGLPEWVKEGAFSRNELIALMRKRMSDAVSRWRGRVNMYKVVNEAYAVDDLFQQRIGPDYVDIAFETVRELDPAAELIYNDYNNHTLVGPASERAVLTRQTVARLASKGLIDKVGIEMIVFYPLVPTKAQVIDALRSYSLPVVVTEFGVLLRDLKGTREERFARQAEIYAMMLEAAIESGVCKEFTVFQVGDKYAAWENAPSLTARSTDHDPTPYDDELMPKPAYYAMLDVLKQHAPR